MIEREIEGKRIVSLGVEELMEEIEKKAREVEKSEEKYRELVKNAVEGIYRMTINGKILEINPAFLNILGYESEEEFKAIDDVSKVYQNPKDRKKFLKKLRKDGEIKGWEGHYRRKDGKPIITNEFARLIEKNGEEIIEGIIHDVTMGKRATIALEKSREKYRDLFENANDLIWTADRKGRYLSVNKMFEEGLGYNKKELIGSQSLDLISKKDKKGAIKYYKKTLRGEPQSYELEVETNDGNKRIFMFKTRPIEENGKIISVHGIGRDITERKRWEEALRESEEKFKILFKENPSPQVYLDEGLRILDINFNFKELFGYELDEIKGKHIDDVVVPEGMMEEAEDINEKAEKGYFYHETVRESKDGRKIPVSISGISTTLKGRKQYITTYEDITDRKKAEEEIKYRQRYFQSLFNDSPEAVVSLDEQFRVMDINPAFQETFGYSLEEIKGKVLDDYILPEDREEEGRELTQKVINGENVATESIRTTKDGREIPVSILGAPVFINSKEVGIFAIYRDITKRKQAEEEAEFYNSLLRHDIGNRNQVTMGYLELLKETDLSKEQIEFIEKALVATKRSNGLIKKVRDLQRIKEKHELEDISLDSVLDKVTKNFSYEAKDKGIKINYGPSKIKVKADSLLEDMFSNLVQNAIIHSGCNEINIYSTNEKDFYKISIEDNGKGIPNDEKEKIFQRRVKGKKSKGSGVGLYLVKTIARSYNGKVEVANRIKKDYSKGTLFNVYIPRG